jgi:hypothetical protein
MIVTHAPDPIREGCFPLLFAGGSIENGKAKDWQADLAKACHGFAGQIVNPRRKQWDPQWSQDPKNKQLRQQIRWELDGLRCSNYKFFHFEDNTMSPITLLELGLVLGSLSNPHNDYRRVFVSCSPRFWRAANVHETCLSSGVTVHRKFGSAVRALQKKLEKDGYNDAASATSAKGPSLHCQRRTASLAR